jgi:aminocarboxymuconate-semialdehyde decarboxylase
MNRSATQRRAFLVGVASTAAIAGLGSYGLAGAARAAEGRKMVTVGGRRVRTVDIHGHCVIPAVADVVANTPFATDDFPGNQTLGPARIQALDARGIDVQVLSINQYWWYAAERELAANIVRTHDEGLADWVGSNPERFVALSSVALQYPDLAAEQLEYAVNELGLRGASVSGTVNGEVPSTEKYDPFWAKAEELNVPVFMHPTNGDNVLNDAVMEGSGNLSNIIGNPLETTLFLSKLIFDGTLDRFPGLKVCGAHGGGYLPSYFERTEITCDVRRNARCMNQKRPRDYLTTQIFADSMVFTEEGLRHLVAEMGASQIVYGTDMPFNWPDTADLIANADFLSDADKEAILGGNLIAMLRIGT